MQCQCYGNDGEQADGGLANKDPGEECQLGTITCITLLEIGKWDNEEENWFLGIAPSPAYGFRESSTCRLGN